LDAEPKQERDDMINPYWIEDRDLKKGEVDYISSAEAQFWKDLLEKYLHPIDDNKEEKVCISLLLYSELLHKHGNKLKV
jgi:chitin synthase